MNRRRDDVRRRFAGKLDDVLTKIRFQGFDAGCLKRCVQMNLFGRHALALDDQPRLTFARNPFYDFIRFACITRPMNLRAN